MRRFLCFSLCLGLMVSACKKKSLEESLNKAITQGKAGGGGGGTVTKKDKAAVLKACLPKINAKMVDLWGKDGKPARFLRRSTTWQPTTADPLVVLCTGKHLPLAFEPHAGFGLGKDAATVTKNLNEMAASKVIQDQFVPRDGNASGWRVHISQANTNVEIPRSEPGQPPVVPESHKGKIIIYDREKVVLVDTGDNRTDRIWAKDSKFMANDPVLVGGWFDCVVDDTTQDVTFEFTEAELA